MARTKKIAKLSDVVMIIPLVPVSFTSLFSQLEGASVVDNNISGKALSLVCDFETVDQAREFQVKVKGQSFLVDHGNTIVCKNE